jgi:hypothetical protein
MKPPPYSPFRKQLIEILRRFDGRDFLMAEIGVYNGDTSATLLRELPNLTVLWGVDPYESRQQGDSYYDSGDMIARMPKAELDDVMRRAMLQTESHGPRYRFELGRSLDIVQLFPIELLDAVFIDGDHSHEAVYADSRAWWMVVKPGGVMIWHDFGNNNGKWTMGVEPAVRQFAYDVGGDLQVGTAFVAWMEKP